MRRSAELAEMQANLVNDANKEPGANNDRLKDKTSNIATLDNGTMVEAFKYLNYCQLAKNSLASKRFHNLIQTHRHSLALLHVNRISMYPSLFEPFGIKIFDKELTPEAYNDWVIRNNYSKQAPLQDQIASTESTQNVPNVYWLYAYAHYKDPSHRHWSDRTNVFSAEVELNDDNRPLFQHFVRLATDPFIYIDYVQLVDQIDVLNLLAGAINSDHDRLQCKKLFFDLNGNSQKSITWAKTHMRCNQFTVWGKGDLNHDEALLDFFLTGAQCTSEVNVNSYDLSKVLVDFVQKFMDLEDSDGSQLVEAIDFKSQATESLNRDYTKFLVKEKRGRHINTHIFEFVNDNIGKKLKLTAKNYPHHLTEFSIKINNL